jgi:hypothetical protein
MELFKISRLNFNKKKLKIKTFSDIQPLNNDKKFPILSLNSQRPRQNSEKLTAIRKENTERLNLSKEELVKENKELKKKIEILELENKQLRKEIKEYNLYYEEEKNLSPNNKKQLSFNFTNNFQSFQELSLPLNNNIQQKLYINLRKPINIKESSFGNKNEFVHSAFSRIYNSPKKIFLDNIIGNKNNIISKGSIILNNFELSSFEDNHEMKNKMNEIKSRMINLLNKYNKIIKRN